MRKTAMSANRSSLFPNRVFQALSGPEAKRLLASCTAFELKYGDVLFEPGERIQYVYSLPAAWCPC